jgi:hypothetical protein
MRLIEASRFVSAWQEVHTHELPQISDVHRVPRFRDMGALCEIDETEIDHVTDHIYHDAGRQYKCHGRPFRCIVIVPLDVVIFRSLVFLERHHLSCGRKTPAPARIDPDGGSRGVGRQGPAYPGRTDKRTLSIMLPA